MNKKAFVVGAVSVLLVIFSAAVLCSDVAQKNPRETYKELEQLNKEITELEKERQLLVKKLEEKDRAVNNYKTVKERNEEIIRKLKDWIKE